MSNMATSTKAMGAAQRVMATGVLAAMRAVSIPLGSFNVPGLLLSAVLAVMLNLVRLRRLPRRLLRRLRPGRARERSRCTTVWWSPKDPSH